MCEKYLLNELLLDSSFKKKLGNLASGSLDKS